MGYSAATRQLIKQDALTTALGLLSAAYLEVFWWAG